VDELQKRIQESVMKDRVATLNEQKIKARYKIQIWFRSGRSMTKPVAFALSAWQSGKRLHGGGDEMMFLCRKHATARDVAPSEVAFRDSSFIRTPTKRGCGLFIPGENSVNDMILCPHCGVSHASESIGDSVFYRLTPNNAASVLVSWFRRLESNADLYAKYTPQDPRSIMMAKSYDPVTARQKKGLTIYPLKNILEDTANGSTLESRFKAFILA
jgi:hypothetical protein